MRTSLSLVTFLPVASLYKLSVNPARLWFKKFPYLPPNATYSFQNCPLDFICFREATEGLYAGIEFDTSEDSAIAIRKTTRKGCARIIDASFDYAKKHNMKKVIAITKRNILKRTDGIFWGEAERAAKENPGIEIEEYYIDNMTQQLVKNPERFNGCVLVSTNLFMDIISECASGSIGSIGVGGGTEDAGDITSSFLYLLLIQGLFSGLAIGKLAEGNLKAGAKHSFALVLMSFLVSTGASLFFG